MGFAKGLGSKVQAKFKGFSMVPCFAVMFALRLLGFDMLVMAV